MPVADFKTYRAILDGTDCVMQFVTAKCYEPQTSNVADPRRLGD